MRKLKHHEQKLLKKHDFMHYKREDNMRENDVMRRYMIQDRNDYVKYNRATGKIQKLLNVLTKLPKDDMVRLQQTTKLVHRLFDLGLVKRREGSLIDVKEVNASAFARRRLPVIMVRLKMCDDLKHAIGYVEQGHVRVGPTVVNDPAFLVPRDREDYVTWVDTSKIRRTINQYNDKLDDYDLL